MTSPGRRVGKEGSRCSSSMRQQSGVGVKGASDKVDGVADVVV